MYKKKNKNFLDFEWFQTDFESAAFKSDTSLLFDTSSPYKGSLESLIYTPPPKSVKFPSIFGFSSFFTSPSSMKME